MQRAAAWLQAAWRRVQPWQRRQRNSPRADRPQGRLLLCHASEPVSSTSEGSVTCAAAPAANAAADAASDAADAAGTADAADAALSAAAAAVSPRLAYGATRAHRARRRGLHVSGARVEM